MGWFDSEEEAKAKELTKELQAKIAKEHGYELVDHRLELYVVPIGTKKRKKNR